MRGDFEQRHDVLDEYYRSELAHRGETDIHVIGEWFARRGYELRSVDYHRKSTTYETALGVVTRPGVLHVEPHIVRVSGCAIVDLHDPEWRRTA